MCHCYISSITHALHKNAYTEIRNKSQGFDSYLCCRNIACLHWQEESKLGGCCWQEIIFTRVLPNISLLCPSSLPGKAKLQIWWHCPKDCTMSKRWTSLSETEFELFSENTDSSSISSSIHTAKIKALCFHSSTIVTIVKMA